MRNVAFAGALALMAAGVVPVWGQEQSTTYQAGARTALDARIASAKASLRLRADQERHWPRIAAAVRAYAERQGFEPAGQNAMKQAAAKALHAQRIIAAAAPLVKVLDAEQRQIALGLIGALGFGHLASAM